MHAEQQALIDLLAETPVDFPDLLRLLHARRYTGAITFHVFKGTITSAEFANDPTRVRLDLKKAIGLDVTRPLDKPA